MVSHSSAVALREFHADMPFTTIADPDKVLYREFGVESSLEGVAEPARLVGGHPP